MYVPIHNHPHQYRANLNSPFFIYSACNSMWKEKKITQYRFNAICYTKNGIQSLVTTNFQTIICRLFYSINRSKPYGRDLSYLLVKTNTQECKQNDSIQ